MANRTDVDLSTIHMSLIWKANTEYYYILSIFPVQTTSCYLSWFFWMKFNLSSFINDSPKQVKVIKKTLHKKDTFSVIFHWLAGLNFFIDIQFSSNLFTGQTTNNVVSGLACVASVSACFRSKERPRNGIFDFGRCLLLSLLVLCSETARKRLLRRQ